MSGTQHFIRVLSNTCSSLITFTSLPFFWYTLSWNIGFLFQDINFENWSGKLYRTLHKTVIEIYTSIKLYSDQQRSQGRNCDSELFPSSHRAPFWNNLFYLVNRVILLSVISAWLWSPMHNQLSLPSSAIESVSSQLREFTSSQLKCEMANWLHMLGCDIWPVWSNNGLYVR